VALNEEPPALAAWVQAPAHESTWKKTFKGVVALGLNMLCAPNEKLGVGLKVRSRLRGVIETVSGTGCSCCSVISSISPLPPGPPR
jgi:hypothetical protein